MQKNEQSALEQQTSSAELIGALLRSLAHTVRTPLSVVSNEIQYFSSLLPKGESDRALTRCRDIDQLLRRYAQISCEAPCFEEVSFAELRALCEGAASPSPGEASADTQERKVRIDRARVVELFALVPKVFGADSVSLQRPSFDEHGCAFMWRGGAPASSNSEAVGEGQMHSSLYRMLMVKGGADIPEAILVDALVLTLGFMLQAKLEDSELAIQVNIGRSV